METSFSCVNTHLNWKKQRCVISIPSLLSAPPLHLLMFFFPSSISPPPPLLPDALSPLVCVWAATARGHRLPCSHTWSPGRVCVCMCVWKRARESTLSSVVYYMNECVCVCVKTAPQKKVCNSVWIYPNVCAAEPKCLSHCVCIFVCVRVCARPGVCESVRALLAQCQVSLMSLSGAFSDGVLPWLSALLQTHCD